MNLKNQWCYSFVDLPDDDRNVLIYSIAYPDIMIGFYLKDKAEWHVCDAEVDKNLEVDCWMDLPEKPKGYTNNLTFRKISEAQYITANAKRMPKGLENFFFVRSQIVNSAAQGKNNCTIKKERISDKIFNKLEEAGYGIVLSNNQYLITW